MSTSYSSGPLNVVKIAVPVSQVPGNAIVQRDGQVIVQRDGQYIVDQRP